MVITFGNICHSHVEVKLFSQLHFQTKVKQLILPVYVILLFPELISLRNVLLLS